MAPGRGRRKPLDVNARKVPFKAKGFLACSIAASIILVAYSYNRVALSKYEQTDLGVLLQAAPPLLAGFVSWLMMWRDEIEIHDGSLMGGFAVLAALGHVATSLSVGLEWAGAALLAAAHGMLAARNAKGMRVAWLKKAIPHGRATEWMVGFGCAAGIQGVLSFQHISQGYGMATACAVAAVYAMATLSMLTATFATYSERFPAVNSGEMFWAVAVLWAAEAARGVSLARAHSMQVTAACGASMLFGTGVAMAGIAAYRRTILRSKNTL